MTWLAVGGGEGGEKRGREEGEKRKGMRGEEERLKGGNEEGEKGEKIRRGRREGGRVAGVQDDLQGWQV